MTYQVRLKNVSFGGGSDLIFEIVAESEIKAFVKAYEELDRMEIRSWYEFSSVVALT